MSYGVEMSNIDVSKTKEESKPMPKSARLFGQVSVMILGGLSILCLVAGIAILAVPASFLDVGDNPVEGTSNTTCTSITPAGSPFTPTVVTTNRQAFLNAWAAYNRSEINRPEGVRLGCEPLFFPSTGATYRGVALIWHGFSSCPQEMAIMGPPLAAHGYDVLIPLMPGHGNALRYEKDAPNYLWGYLTLGLSLLVLSCMGCTRVCPCAKICECCCECCKDKEGNDNTKEALCGHTNRTRGIYGCCIIMTVSSSSCSTHITHHTQPSPLTHHSRHFSLPPCHTGAINRLDHSRHHRIHWHSRRLGLLPISLFRGRRRPRMQWPFGIQ